jgi:hypothetical protein
MIDPFCYLHFFDTGSKKRSYVWSKRTPEAIAVFQRILPPKRMLFPARCAFC